MLKARQRLGKYRIRKRLAQGAFSEVYEAVDTIEGISVALKIPHPQLIDAHVLEGFRKEVRLTARLDHPNIQLIKNAQFIDDLFVIAYPLGEGSLADRMQRRITVRAVLELVEQMLAGLAHAHEQRIIHCDVKPENMILFSSTGTPRLRVADFGISRVALRTLEASGSGTVGYLAPEQALGKPSFQSDVFALGLTITEMLTAELPEWPFDWPPVGFERMRAKIHPELCKWLRRSLEVDQYRRFPDASAMLAAFQRLKARGMLLAPTVRRKRARSRSSTTADWKAVRLKLFKRQYGKALRLDASCAKCKGPVSEPMLACPWCSHPRKKHRGPTGFPAACPRCKRGTKLDWRYCAWCHGPGFDGVSTRAYSDVRYTARCSNRKCPRKDLMPFMRYCPWCRTKVRKSSPIPGSRDRCARCQHGVVADFWVCCPWCERSLPKKK